MFNESAEVRASVWLGRGAVCKIPWQSLAQSGTLTTPRALGRPLVGLGNRLQAEASTHPPTFCLCWSLTCLDN